jgi:ribosomal protein L37E
MVYMTKKNSKTKFTCERCGQNVWAKPDAAIACGPCNVMMDAA